MRGWAIIEAVKQNVPLKLTYKGADHVMIIPIANGIPPELEKYLERLDNGKQS
jgi:hypothetical protein